MKKIIYAFLLFSFLLLTSCKGYFKETDNMKQFKEDVISMDYVLDMKYELEGAAHSSNSLFVITLTVDVPDNVDVENEIVPTFLRLLYNANECKEDIVNIGAIDYSVVVCDQNNDILYLMSTDEPAFSKLDKWNSETRKRIIVTEDEIIIIDRDTEYSASEYYDAIGSYE